MIIHNGMIIDAMFVDAPTPGNRQRITAASPKLDCCIEHVLVFMTGAMGGLTILSIGMRAVFNFGLTNLVYNLCRYFLSRKEAGTG